MVKKFILRGLSSYCICVTVSVIIGLILVLAGMEQTCVPEFIERVGSPLSAAFLQMLLMGMIGFAFGAGSVLFEIEHWSFLKQGAIHLGLTMAVWVPVELICFSPITLPAVFSFAASAIATYAITWGIQYFIWHSKVNKLNEQIHRRNSHERD